MVYIEDKLKNFELLCKRYKENPSKKLDKEVRKMYMNIYYLIEVDNQLFECMEYRKKLKDIAKRYGF